MSAPSWPPATTRSLRLHQLRLAGELAEIRATQLRFTPDETRRLLTAAGIELPDPVVATLQQRPKAGRPGCGWLHYP